MTTQPTFTVAGLFARRPYSRLAKPVTTAKRTLSIQAGPDHYCSQGSVEVLVCDGPTPRRFIARDGFKPDRVYGFVPHSWVEAVIAADGGEVRS